MSRRPFVYILASPNGRALYIGVTTDFGRRLEKHRLGLSEHTSRYNITKLVYAEEHETAPDAIAREKKVSLIDAANPEWRDISGDIF
jgi:putative endonuclease